MSFTRPQPPADQLHDMASLMQSVIKATINVQRSWDKSEVLATTHDARLLDSLLFDTLVNASATIALLRRMEHKLRYPDAFVADEQVKAPTP